MDINDLIRDSYENSASHGFWDDQLKYNIPTPIGEKLMLIVTEVAEAMEDYRAGVDLVSMTVADDGKVNGFPAELADIMIRIADLAGHLGIDLDFAIRQKMAYNKTRPIRHGKVC